MSSELGDCRSAVAGAADVESFLAWANENPVVDAQPIPAVAVQRTEPALPVAADLTFRQQYFNTLSDFPSFESDDDLDSVSQHDSFRTHYLASISQFPTFEFEDDGSGLGPSATQGAVAVALHTRTVLKRLHRRLRQQHQSMIQSVQTSNPSCLRESGRTLNVCRLVQLPAAVLQHIASWLSPQLVAYHVSRSCSFMWQIMQQSRLWRLFYDQHYHITCEHANHNWRNMLCTRLRNRSLGLVHECQEVGCQCLRAYRRQAFLARHVSLVHSPDLPQTSPAEPVLNLIHHAPQATSEALSPPRKQSRQMHPCRQQGCNFIASSVHELTQHAHSEHALKQQCLIPLWQLCALVFQVMHESDPQYSHRLLADVVQQREGEGNFASSVDSAFNQSALSQSSRISAHFGAVQWCSFETSSSSLLLDHYRKFHKLTSEQRRFLFRLGCEWRLAPAPLLSSPPHQLDSCTGHLAAAVKAWSTHSFVPVSRRVHTDDSHDGSISSSTMISPAYTPIRSRSPQPQAMPSSVARDLFSPPNLGSAGLNSAAMPTLSVSVSQTDASNSVSSDASVAFFKHLLQLLPQNLSAIVSSRQVNESLFVALFFSEVSQLQSVSALPRNPPLLEQIRAFAMTSAPASASSQPLNVVPDFISAVPPTPPLKFRSYTCPAPKCEFGFPTLDQLRSHFGSSHSKRSAADSTYVHLQTHGVHACTSASDCTRVFLTSAHLKRHQDEHHIE